MMMLMSFGAVRLIDTGQYKGNIQRAVATMPRSSSSKEDRPVRAAARKRQRQEQASDSATDEQPRARTARSPRTSSPGAQLEKRGDYTLKYQDDNTGSRYIHPTALRFTLNIVEDLARDTTTSVSKSLKDDGELEESRKVQVCSEHHVKSVLTQVRQKLRETKIPARYVKIEDLNLNDLPGINRTRREEIAANERLAKKLEQQLEVLREQCDTVKRQRDEAQAKLNAQQNHVIHPLIQSAAAATIEDTNVNEEKRKHEDCIQTEQTSLQEWLKAIPSPYD